MRKEVASEASDRPPDGRPNAAEDATPRFVRRFIGILLAVLGSGALYLIAVRREAILIDLANFSTWCF